MWDTSDSDLDAEEEAVLLLLRRRRRRRERERRRQWYIRPLNTTRRVDGEWYRIIQRMSLINSERHHQYFRMSVAKFDDLVRRVSPHIQHGSNHVHPISTEERLAITLRYLAHGHSHQSMAASFLLGVSTVGEIVREVCKALWLALKDEFVAFPTGAQWSRLKAEFWDDWNFPNCVGAIDGKHVQIKAPVNSGSSYYNYKGKYTMYKGGTWD